jgi:hypothetical protein
MGKQQRSPPKGRRWLVGLHVFASAGQRKSARRNDAQISIRLLTVIRGNAILEFAKTREGLPELRFGGLFSFAFVFLI